MISLLWESLQTCPKYITVYFDFGYLCHFTTERSCVFFSLFLLLGEIRRVLSGKMATNQLKISQKIDLDSFHGIDGHREVIKVTILSQPPP